MPHSGTRSRLLNTTTLSHKVERGWDIRGAPAVEFELVGGTGGHHEVRSCLHLRSAPGRCHTILVSVKLDASGR